MIVTLVAAEPGLTVQVSAPAGTPRESVAAMPTAGAVVAWTIEDGLVQPVFLAAGRAWTPAQYRGVHGATLILDVVREW